MRCRLTPFTRRPLLVAAAFATIVLTAALPPTLSHESHDEKKVTMATGDYRSTPGRADAEPRDFISDISLTNNDFQSTALCRESCFAATYAFSTVPFFTLDEPRSVTLSYNGDRAFPRPFFFVTVAPDYGAADIAE